MKSGHAWRISSLSLPYRTICYVNMDLRLNILFFLSVIFKLSFSSAQAGPTIQPFAFPKNITKGQSVSVMCAVLSGSSPFTFYWYKDEKLLTDHPLTKVHTSEENSILSLKSADHSRSGNYTCSVSNAAGSDNFTAELMVFEQPEWIVMPENCEVVLGKSIAIDCLASGIPEANITWLKLKGDEWIPLNGDTRYKTYLNGTLQLENAEEKDDGTYECVASNGIGNSLKKGISLRVHVPPIFREEFHMQRVRSSHSAALQCEVIGETPITVKWSKEYLVESENSRHKIQETPLPNGLLSELYITRVTRQDAGLYVCKAANEYGQKERTIKLVVLEPPASPSDVTVKQISSSGAIVEWVIPYSGNSPVTKYIIQYWKDTGAPPKLEEVDATAGDDHSTELQLKGLRSGTSYVVRIIAENEFGQSTPSIPIKFSTADENPSGYPTDITVFPRGPHALLIRWKAPAPEQRNGVIRGYDLGYRDRRNSGPYVYREVSLTPGLQQEHVLGNLSSGVEYEIVVRAFNSAGRGPSSMPVLARTSEKGPLMTPVMWVESASTTSIAIQWSDNNPDEESSSIQYLLHYRAEEGPWLKRKIPLSNHGSFALTGLQQNTVYELYMQAMSDGETSSPSTVVTVKTAVANFLQSSLTKVTEATHQTTLVISLSVVVSAVVIVCIIAGACVYVIRIRHSAERKISDEMGSRHLAEQRSNSVSTRMSHQAAANFRYVDVNSRPLLWCSTPAPPPAQSHEDYPSPYATLPLRYCATPSSRKRWLSNEGLSPAASERSESLINQRVDVPEEKNTSCQE